MQNDTGVLCKMWYNEFTDEREVLAMILVDHDIRAFLANAAANAADQTTIYHGDESCITGIGYDLRTSRVYQNGKAVSDFYGTWISGRIDQGAGETVWEKGDRK